MSWEGRCALVTGAGSGIGRAVALRFAREGARVALVGRTEASLAETSSLLPKPAGADGHRIFVGDVADERFASRAVEETLRSFGAIDAFVHCAGVWRPTALTGGNAVAVFDDTIRTNLRGTFVMIHAVAPSMIERKRGAIVTLASVAGVRGFAGSSAYAASKAAVLNLSQSLAAELAPHGIRLNAIAPGNVETPMNAAVRTPELAAVYESLRRVTPTGRVYAAPDEIAALALFLAGDEARTVVGSIVVADEGFTAAIAPIG